MSAKRDEVLEKLNLVLSRSKKSKLYSEKFQDISTALNNVEDMGSIPVTTKEELRENAPFGSLCVDLSEVVEYHESFGTTGTSISTYLTKNDFERWTHEIELCDVNFNSNDVVIIRFPYAISDPAHIVQAAVKKNGGMAVPVSSRTVISPHSRVINLMHKLKATIVCCMPLELIMLAETSKLLGYDPKKDFRSLRAFCTAGEVLSKERKKQIERIWGVPIYNLYGTTENGNIAYTCKNGNLHVDEEDFYVEIIDSRTKKPVKIGEKGILTVTNMTLEACPLIRYYTGDIASLHKEDCNCGHKGKILKHYGRKENIIKIKDKEFSVVDIQDALLTSVPQTISPFFLICLTNKGLLFRLEKDSIETAVDTNLIKKKLEKILGCTCFIELLEFNQLFDRKILLHVGMVIKPNYIVDYRNTNNYPYSLNEVLKGYHTF